MHGETDFSCNNSGHPSNQGQMAEMSDIPPNEKEVNKGVWPELGARGIGWEGE